MAFQSICPTVSLEEPKADYKTAEKLEQFRVSRQAIYMAAFPGTKYLPFQAVERAWSRNTSLPVKCTCGKSLPMVAVRIKYQGGGYQNFILEKQASADRLLSILRENFPNIVFEPETAERQSEISGE